MEKIRVYDERIGLYYGYEAMKETIESLYAKYSSYSDDDLTRKCLLAEFEHQYHIRYMQKYKELGG